MLFLLFGINASGLNHLYPSSSFSMSVYVVSLVLVSNSQFVLIDNYDVYRCNEKGVKIGEDRENNHTGKKQPKLC